MLLHMTFSSFVKVSKNCRPFLPSQFLTIVNCSACGVLYVVNVLFTSNLKVLSLHCICLLHLPVEGWLLHGRSSYLGSCHTLWSLCCGHCHGLDMPLWLPLSTAYGDCLTYYYLSTCHFGFIFSCLPK